MDDIKAGDVVVRIGGDPKNLPYGTLRRVRNLHPVDSEGDVGVSFTTDPVLGSVWKLKNWRKIDAPKSELSERIRACRPIRETVEA
jgi:hypothetical protein